VAVAAFAVPAVRDGDAPIIGGGGGRVLLEDDFDQQERGERVWQVRQAAPGSLDYLDEPSFPGRERAMGNRLEPGDTAEDGAPRSELSSPLRFDEGDERWFRLPVRFGQWELQSDAWALVWQAHSGENSPPLALYVESDELLLRLKNGETNESYWEMPFEQDRWYDIVIGVRFSTDEDDGWVEVWVDGKQQTLENGETRMGAATLSPELPESYDKLGLYMHEIDSGAREVLHGLYAVGTTREAVMRVS
jgi:Polysaccharide lyase